MLSWKVKRFDCNGGREGQKIYDFDVLKILEPDVKKLKKKCSSKQEFKDELKKELRYYFWSKAEHELMLKKTDDNRILLYPWVGCYDIDRCTIDVTDNAEFDWVKFAEEHINAQRFTNEAKIDVFDQVMFKYDEFVDYCWYTHLPYERHSPKFDIY